MSLKALVKYYCIYLCMSCTLSLPKIQTKEWVHVMLELETVNSWNHVDEFLWEFQMGKFIKNMQRFNDSYPQLSRVFN